MRISGLVGETDIIFVADDTNRVAKVEKLGKVIENGDINCIARLFNRLK